MPIGAKITVEKYDKTKIVLTKHAPAFQFKKPFWYIEATGRYMKASDVLSYYVNI